MSTIDICFNAMVLFWIAVQQICLCCVKWAYEDVMGRASRMRGYAAAQGVLFALLFLAAFDLALGFRMIYGWLPTGARFFYGRLKWNFLCEVMLILDALLVLYGWRMYRLYMRAPRIPFEASRPARVFAEDLAVTIAFLAPFLWYHAGMTRTALSRGLGEEEVRTLQFFFIKLANFFYALFEGTAAALLWRMYKKIRGEAMSRGRA